MVLLAHVDGGPGCAAGGYQCRKCGDNQNQRQAYAHAGKGQIAVTGNVTDVDTVHDVVEHIYKLGDDRRDGQLPQELADGLRA